MKISISDKISYIELNNFLKICDECFKPVLSTVVNIEDYSHKLISNANFIIARSGNDVIGVVAFYCNSFDINIAFISSVSVHPDFWGKGIANKLIKEMIIYSMNHNRKKVRLEVNKGNIPAINLYRKQGFTNYKELKNNQVLMELNFEE